jgi:hypothetical protein
MLQQDVAILPRSQLVNIEQGVPIGDVMNGAADLTEALSPNGNKRNQPCLR